MSLCVRRNRNGGRSSTAITGCYIPIFTVLISQFRVHIRYQDGVTISSPQSVGTGVLQQARRDDRHDWSDRWLITEQNHLGMNPTLIVSTFQ